MPATARLDIAVTDKNPHVREFLCRELIGLGHWARALSSTGELFEALSGPRPPQVLVLDPEAAGARLAELARLLKHRAGSVAVMLHVFEGSDPQPEFDGALVVEKQPHMGALKTALTALAAEIDRLSGAGEATGLGHTQEQA